MPQERLHYCNNTAFIPFYAFIFPCFLKLLKTSIFNQLLSEQLAMNILLAICRVFSNSLRITVGFDATDGLVTLTLSIIILCHFYYQRSNEHVQHRKGKHWQIIWNICHQVSFWITRELVIQPVTTVTKLLIRVKRASNWNYHWSCTIYDESGNFCKKIMMRIVKDCENPCNVDAIYSFMFCQKITNNPLKFRTFKVKKSEIHQHA